MLTELIATSARDASEVRALERLSGSWRGHLVGILERGQAEGAVRPDVNAERAATAPTAQIKGVGLPALWAAGRAEFAALVEELAEQVWRWASPGGYRHGQAREANVKGPPQRRT